VARVRGAHLPPGDAVRGEWDLVVLSPHFAAALLARDLGDVGPERERRFDFAVTHRRDVVIRAANALLARVTPALVAATPPPVATTPCPAV
jgi:DICT domain-containing protein